MMIDRDVWMKAAAILAEHGANTVDYIIDQIIDAVGDRVVIADWHRVAIVVEDITEAAAVTNQQGPMDLENMRSIGIRSLEILCGCGRRAEVNVDQFPGHYTVPAMTRFLRCQECGKRPKASRPNGAEMRRDPMGAGLVITEQRGPIRI